MGFFRMSSLGIFSPTSHHSAFLSVWKSFLFNLLTYVQSQWLFLQPCPCTEEPIKGIPRSSESVLDFEHFLLVFLFLEFPFLWLHYSFVLACYPLFSIKAFSILIIVIFKCPSDNFKISAVSESSPESYFVSLDWSFITFSIFWNLLLKV